MIRTLLRTQPPESRFDEPDRFAAVRSCAPAWPNLPVFWLSLLVFWLVYPATMMAGERAAQAQRPTATAVSLRVPQESDPVLHPPLRPIETLILKNGDRLSGHSHDVYSGGLLFENLYGSRTVIPLDDIDRLEWESPANATLDSALAVVPDAPLAATPPVVVPPATVVTPPPPPKPLTPVEQLEQQLELFRDESRMWLYGGGVNPLRFARRIYELEYATARVWTKRFSLGGAYLTGNSRQESVDMAADFERTVPGRSTQINLAGRYGAVDGIRTANRWIINGTHDLKSDKSQWLAYGKIMDEYDEFQNLDYRGVYSIGLGYRFFDDDKRRVIVRVGPAATIEIFHRPVRQRFTGDILNELEVRWPLAERLQLEQRTTVHPSMTDYHVVRFVSNTALMLALDEKRCWSLRLGFLHVYNSVPNPGRLQSDYTTNLSIVYQRQ